MNIQKFTTFKTILIALVLTISTNQLFAQTTNGIFFQAVARDNFSNPAKDRKIYVQSSIIQTTPTGTKVLTEEHQANTDATGVFSISLGNGVRVGGTASSLTTIDWSKGPFYLNLKVAITPIGGNSNWDYTKEWVDMGTTSFGAVPFALYSASSAKVDDKLNITDTSKMLAIYAKAMTVKTLETSLATKLTAADTLTMLAPYAKAAYTIDSSFFKSQLATKLSLTDTINYTKQKYTDSAFAKKLNLADSAIYVTKTQLAAKTFDQTPITNAIATKLNIADTIYYTKQKFTDSAIAKKLNISDSLIYVTPTQLATKTFDQTPITNAIATKLNIADSTKYVTPTQLAAKTFDTTSLSIRINLKAAASDVTSAINAEANTARAAELALTNNITSNTASISANAAAITSEATTARAAELALTNNITSNTASISANAAAINAEATTARAAELALTNNITSNTASISANAAAITSEATTARAAELALTNNITSNTASISANAAAITAEATTARAAELILTNNITSNTASITANAAAITAEDVTARAAELVLSNNVAANTASINSNSNALNLKAPISSPTFTGTLTAPIFATTPQALTAGSTITWDPSLGLNASVTLNQNSTLSFSTTPPSGSYGTLVITQDANGGRTITLPNTSNKVLGSTSTTSIELSTAAGAKDIVNFYFDGINCYWNIGQGYGSAATASSTNLASGVTGSLPVANGGTGATTLTGLIKGNGTSSMTAATAGTDYQAPITLTTTGTGAATLSGTTLNIPAVSSTVNSNTLSGTVAVVNGGTGATSKTTAFDALSPMTTAGDLIYGGTNGTGTRLSKGNNGTVLTMENNIPTWLTSIRATAGSSYNAAVGFSFLGGDWARNTGMFSDNPDGGAAATLKFRIATSNSTADPYLEISPSKVSVFPTTASTSKTTGALTVAGGLGVTENIYASNLNTSGTITSGAVTYPIAHGTANQVLTTTGSGTLSWTTPASPGVPYTGATGAVNLGAYNLTVSSFTIGQGKTPASGDNLAIGRSALNNTTSNGWPNIGLGSNSLNQTTDGKYNIGLGLNALYANTTGSNNIGIGFEAGRNASTFSNITAVGMEALKYESGAGNTAIGSYAGKPSTNAVYSGTTNSTFLGYNTTTGKTAEATITNSTAIGYGAAVTASHTIQLGNTSVTDVKTSGMLTTGAVTYPIAHGTSGQVLTTTGSGTLTFTTPAVAKPISDQFTATAAQTSFTLTQTPITNTTVSPNVKPNVWMYINGIRTNNLAYSVSGTTVTYTASSNNNYAIVVGDRIQFDYAY